jgi:predicted nucleotidyltransferase
VDILVELERPTRISLIDLVELEHELSERLGIKVDMISSSKAIYESESA